MSASPHPPWLAFVVISLAAYHYSLVFIVLWDLKFGSESHECLMGHILMLLGLTGVDRHRLRVYKVTDLLDLSVYTSPQDAFNRCGLFWQPSCQLGVLKDSH